MSILREIYEAAKIRDARHARNVFCSCLSVFMLLWRFVYGTLSSGPGGAAPSSFSTIGRKLFFYPGKFSKNILRYWLEHGIDNDLARWQ